MRETSVDSWKIYILFSIGCIGCLWTEYFGVIPLDKNVQMEFAMRIIVMLGFVFKFGEGYGRINAMIFLRILSSNISNNYKVSHTRWSTEMGLSVARNFSP
jgi:hypothetical protein